MASFKVHISNIARFHKIILFTLSVLVQFLYFRDCFSNTALNQCLPSAVDSFDYEKRARVFLEFGFRAAFGDAFRVPGYPLLISFFIAHFGQVAFSALRIFQIILTSVTVLLVYRTLNDTFNKSTSFFASLIFLLMPSWYFSPLILAESLSYFLFVLLIIVSIKVINRRRLEIKELLIFTLLISLATYLKPNHILWVIPILFLVLALSKARLLATFALLALLGICLSPWLIFVNRDTSSPFILTSASGGNFYVGTGMQLNYDNGPLAKAAIFWKVDPKNNSNDIIHNTSNLDIRLLNDIYSAKALDIWMERPLRQMGFGLTKITIAFSIFTDSLLQLFLGIIFLVSLIFAIYVTMSRNFLSKSSIFCVLYLSFVLVLAFQAFVFQADRRFVFPILIPAWLLVFESFNPRIGKIRLR